MEYMFADNDIIMAAKVLAYMFNLEELVHKEPCILDTRTYLFSDLLLLNETHFQLVSRRWNENVLSSQQAHRFPNPCGIYYIFYVGMFCIEEVYNVTSTSSAADMWHILTELWVWW